MSEGRADEPRKQMPGGTDLLRMPFRCIRRLLHLLDDGLRGLAIGISGLGLVSLLEQLGKFAILFAVILWISELPDRRKSSISGAWNVINSARDSASDGGRAAAIRDLTDWGVNLWGIDLEDAIFIDADLHDVQMGSANLGNVNFQNADLRGARFEHAKLDGAFLWLADLRGADLQGADLIGADLSSVKASGIYLMGANFLGANLSEADLSGSIANGTGFRAATLTAANMKGLTAVGSDFTGARISSFVHHVGMGGEPSSDVYADLRGAKLRSSVFAGADLSDIEHLDEVDFQGACYDTATRWPEGFNPRAAGALCLDCVQAEDRADADEIRRRCEIAASSPAR